MSLENIVGIVDRIDKNQSIHREELKWILQCIRDLPSDRIHRIVEIGSHLGRTSTGMGLVIQVFHPSSHLWCIDPYEVGIPRAGEGMSDAYSFFVENICNHGLQHQVTHIARRSTDVDWIYGPISLIFIDGAHDRQAVLSDFKHFRPHLAPGAHVFFHDYRKKDNGVNSAVNDLVMSGWLIQSRIRRSLYHAMVPP